MGKRSGLQGVQTPTTPHPTHRSYPELRLPEKTSTGKITWGEGRVSGK